MAEIISIDTGLARPVSSQRIHPLRVAAAAAVLLALLLEVAASFAARRTHGPTQFRTYSAPSATPVKDPRC